MFLFQNSPWLCAWLTIGCIKGALCSFGEEILTQIELICLCLKTVNRQTVLVFKTEKKKKKNALKWKHKPFPLKVAALWSQQQFASWNCHWNKQLQHNSHRGPALRIQKRCGGTRHDHDVLEFFSVCFPSCPPFNLNTYPLTVHNFIDAVIMCCDWDPDPQKILESDKVTFFAHNYLIT